MNKLNRFYLTQNISIDNALSMNQILHQIVNQIKEIVEFINNLELRANEYTDQEILKLKNDLESQLTTLEQTLKTYTDNSISTYNTEVINPQLTEIRNTIDNVNQLLNNRIDREVGILNRKIDSVESSLIVMINDTKEYLEELIRKGNQLVYSSISGRKIPIQDTLFEIGNVLKQILSYNWNSIDEFKTVLNEYWKNTLIDYTTSFGNDLFTKGFLPSDVLEEEGHRYIYIRYNGQSEFDNRQIGQYLPMGYGYGNSNDTIISATGPLFLYKIEEGLVRLDLNDIEDNVNYNYKFVGLIFNNNVVFQDTNECELYYKKTNGGTFNITFNSIKNAMEFIEVNYNSLAYTGVNTFYELNETEMLFDTDGVKSDYFTGTKYKVIHNNFDSDFFKEVENINEGE